MKSYQAYAKDCRVTANSPKEAAEMFFATFPSKRKCSIIEGKVDGDFFVVTYGRTSEGEWPVSIRDVTKKMVASL